MHVFAAVTIGTLIQALLGLICVVFTFAIPISLLFQGEPYSEKAYQQFKKRLNSMSKEQRDEELKKHHTFYFLTPIERWVGRYDPKDWEGMRKQRYWMQQWYERYMRGH